MIVEHLPPKLEKNLNEFVLTVRNLLGEDLKSIILYGSAARGEFDTKRSDLNLLVVFDQVEFRHLATLAPLTKKWNRQRIATPLVVSPQYIASALDVYPLEFLDMQSARRVLFGDDVLADINPPVQAIRRQCEQEARGKLLHLREIVMETALKPKHLQQAMILSVPSFIRIGRHVLRLLEQPPKMHAKEVIDELRKATQLPLEGLEIAWNIKTGERTPSRSDITSFFETYLNDVFAITTFVDNLKVA
jgi:predicted nucleotidyltransferase